MTTRLDTAAAPARPPARAGSFYPADSDELARLVDRLLATARPLAEAAKVADEGLAGILVPHAGLVFSGPVAASAWRLATMARRVPSTVVLLGTNHSALWLDGVGVWDGGAWHTPLGAVEVDQSFATDVLALGPPFAVDREAHRSEHSLEVQLPFLFRALPGARIVPLAIATGRGDLAVRAGELLGQLIAERRATGADVLLAISTDMAHYPPAAIGATVTDELAPIILSLDPTQLARREAEISRSGRQGVVCGMCGIEPTVLGLAALRAIGVQRGVRLAAATSADAGGPSARTVGYLAVAFAG